MSRSFSSRRSDTSAAQMGQGDGGLLPRRAEVGGIAALAALQAAAAQQQRRAAGQHAHRVEKLAQEKPPLAVLHRIGQILPHGAEQRQAAQYAQHRADGLHGLGALVGINRRFRHLLHGLLHLGLGLR